MRRAHSRRSPNVPGALAAARGGGARRRGRPCPRPRSGCGSGRAAVDLPQRDRDLGDHVRLADVRALERAPGDERGDEALGGRAGRRRPRARCRRRRPPRSPCARTSRSIPSSAGVLARQPHHEVAPAVARAQVVVGDPAAEHLGFALRRSEHFVEGEREGHQGGRDPTPGRMFAQEGLRRIPLRPDGRAADARPAQDGDPPGRRRHRAARADRHAGAPAGKAPERPALPRDRRRPRRRGLQLPAGRRRRDEHGRRLRDVLMGTRLRRLRDAARLRHPALGPVARGHGAVPGRPRVGRRERPSSPRRARSCAASSTGSPSAGSRPRPRPSSSSSSSTPPTRRRRRATTATSTRPTSTTSTTRSSAPRGSSR